MEKISTTMRNSQYPRKATRCYTSEIMPHNDLEPFIIWKVLLDLLMSPNFQPYIRWTGNKLEFVIIDPFVVFTEFMKRKPRGTHQEEPTPENEDPGERWKNHLISEKDVKYRLKGLRSENYKKKDDTEEHPKKPWVENVNKLKGGYVFTTYTSICDKLQMSIEELLQYAEGVGRLYKNHGKATPRRKPEKRNSPATDHPLAPERPTQFKDQQDENTEPSLMETSQTKLNTGSSVSHSIQQEPSLLSDCTLPDIRTETVLMPDSRKEIVQNGPYGSTGVDFAYPKEVVDLPYYVPLQRANHDSTPTTGRNQPDNLKRAGSLSDTLLKKKRRHQPYCKENNIRENEPVTNREGSLHEVAWQAPAFYQYSNPIFAETHYAMQQNTQMMNIAYPVCNQMPQHVTVNISYGYSNDQENFFNNQGYTPYFQQEAIHFAQTGFSMPFHSTNAPACYDTSSFFDSPSNQILQTHEAKKHNNTIIPEHVAQKRNPAQEFLALDNEIPENLATIGSPFQSQMHLKIKDISNPEEADMQDLINYILN